ncbi:hypothetical protein CNEO4_1960002 [Clostridium neonatale]|uniref:BhlA/UviB family holin-like peptide n=6 Tax=Clostridium neonatale TaxID=137838 RepID=UPI00291B7099|nr:BhlA/UviB family holin-like peptide [Clostridium neonatale]CAI3570076.1 hypothetical protein CNEO4_1960002 [Clostridium neonatale]
MKVGATLENELAKTIVSQGAWAALFIWLLIETRKESRLREEKLQNVISKNQEVISELATKFNVVEEIKEDVEEIKNKIEMIKESLTQLLVIIACGAISVGTAYVTLYTKKLTEKVKAETDKLKDENQKALINSAIDRANDLVTKNVVKMEQTLVKEIKEKTEDGDIKKEELQKIAESVKENVLNQLSKESQDLINLEIKDLSGYIEAQIEVALGTLKNQVTV